MASPVLGTTVRRKLILVIGIIILIGISVVTHLELYFAPSPYIDTTFTDGFSFEEFSKVYTKMARSEVEALIGKGNGIISVLPDEALGEIECVQYSDDGAVEPFLDFAWIGVGICYDEQDTVTRKYQSIVYN